MWTCIGEELADGRVKIALIEMIGPLLSGLTTAMILLTLGTNLNTFLRQKTSIGVFCNSSSTLRYGTLSKQITELFVFFPQIYESSNGLHEIMHSHTVCIHFTFLHYAFSYESSNCLHEEM